MFWVSHYTEIIAIEMNKEFKKLAVQLAKVTATQNAGTWLFKFVITVFVGGIAGLMGAHIPK